MEIDLDLALPGSSIAGTVQAQGDAADAAGTGTGTVDTGISNLAGTDGTATAGIAGTAGNADTETLAGTAGTATLTSTVDTAVGTAPHAAVASSYSGPGFYVQPGAHVSTRVPVPMAPGDVVAHSFDLQHGVEVHGGRRCSVIMWFTDSLASCASKESRPWYHAAAEQGDADAQYNLGAQLDRARTDPKRALALLRAAAGQGHFMAQNDLASMLLGGRGCPGAKVQAAEAEAWLQESAAQGFFRAMLGLSQLYEERGDTATAAMWLKAAAEQKADPDVAFQLGMAYLYGPLASGTIDGSAAADAVADGHSDSRSDVNRGGSSGGSSDTAVEGRRLLTEAAEMGHPLAQSMLGQLLIQLAEGSGTPKLAHAHVDDAQATHAEGERWLERATEQGCAEGCVALARLKCTCCRVSMYFRTHILLRYTLPLQSCSVWTCTTEPAFCIIVPCYTIPHATCIPSRLSFTAPVDARLSHVLVRVWTLCQLTCLCMHVRVRPCVAGNPLHLCRATQGRGGGCTGLATRHSQHRQHSNTQTWLLTKNYTGRNLVLYVRNGL